MKASGMLLLIILILWGVMAWILSLQRQETSPAFGLIASLTAVLLGAVVMGVTYWWTGDWIHRESDALFRLGLPLALLGLVGIVVYVFRYIYQRYIGWRR